MRLSLRRLRAVSLVALIGFCFFVSLPSFIFLAVVPTDFLPPLQHKRLTGESSVIRQTTEKLNSIKQEISEGLRVPAGNVSRDRSYHEPVTDRGNESTGGNLLRTGLRDDRADREVLEQNEGDDGADQEVHEQNEGDDGADQEVHEQNEGDDGADRALHEQNEGNDDAGQEVHELNKGDDGAGQEVHEQNEGHDGAIREAHQQDKVDENVNGEVDQQNKRDDGGDEEIHRQNKTTSANRKEQPRKVPIGEQSGGSHHRQMVNEKVNEMEDQLITAKAYLQFAPPNSNSHLVRELKSRIKEIQRVLGHVRGSNLPRGALQKIRAMEDTLSKANKAYPDCSAMASKLRAMTQNTEEQLRAQRSQASYLIHLAANTFPKGLHCLSMRLTAEYFTLLPEDRQLPNRNKVRNGDLYHFAIFSDNILATAVAVNSTIASSQAPDKVVIHIVTDSLNFPAMTMWFLTNPPDQLTIHIQSMDDFKWLPADFNSVIKQPGVQDPRFISPLNHLRFYLPEIFPYLTKILLLDHDVVVQTDLRALWKIDMKGKVMGVVETCGEDDSSHRLDMLLDFSEPSIAKKFDRKACLWAFGMNIIDLDEWRRRGLTRVYNKWLQVGRRRKSWKAGSTPLGHLTFYNHTFSLNMRWHVVGLGQDSVAGKTEIEQAAVIHYSGNMKPWLEIGIPRFRGYWSKFLNYDLPYLQQCNIHE